MSENTGSLGGYLRAARTRAGLSLRQLASRAEVNYGHLARIENGERAKPAPDVLQRLADALAIDSAELFAFLGIKPAATLPPPRIYFRDKFGVDEAEADILASLIENYRAQKKEDTKEGDVNKQ
jgi:transcriptional regulator with XRE-family HTH domain